MAYRTVLNNDPTRDAQADDLNQFANSFNGVPGYGQPMDLTQLDADRYYVVIQPRDGDARGLKILRPDGSVMLQAQGSGCLIAADAGEAQVPVVTGATQTLSGKTVSDGLVYTDQGSTPSAPGAGLFRAYSKGGGLYGRAGAAGAEMLLSALVRLAPDVILGSTVASLSYTGIPTGCRSLLLVYSLRGDAAATTADLLLRCNADAGTNYDYAASLVTASITQLSGDNATSIKLGRIPAASAPAGAYGGGQATLLDYADTTHHKLTSGTGTYRPTAGGTVSMLGGGSWKSNAAVNAITLLPSSGNLVAGSCVALYGYLL